MPVFRARRGDIVRIRRLDCKLLVRERNGHHPDQILGQELGGKRPGRLRIFTEREIVAREAGAGMQMLLPDEDS